MREIKFRAWNNREKVMSLLRGFDFLIKQAIINCPNEKSKTAISSWDYKDKEIKLMQFTGLQDKNGKDIYEGDIVIYQYIFEDKESTFEIVWNVDRNGFYAEDEENMWCLEKELKKNFEVIGNIYENPELLEVGEY